ncbi:TonB-dependent receptor domain-containing protein [Hymenobacter sp. BRD67]|uniref:TonB-dependent receptor domain-containing protein n=1 Tax=Hymenobacter sp. BRD67 TaxID=2675877 RepID=UPI00293C1351|nr:TonB-dependent receptor [Hymenobacter sp. BRD67]
MPDFKAINLEAQPERDALLDAWRRVLRRVQGQPELCHVRHFGTGVPAARGRRVRYAHYYRRYPPPLAQNRPLRRYLRLAAAARCRRLPFRSYAGRRSGRLPGQHFDELTWAQRGNNIPETGTPYYSEPNAHKLDVNTYARATVALSDNLSAFGDVQYRHVSYELFAPDGSPNGGKSQQTINFDFLNPKAGLTYQVKEGVAAYASYALAQREPTRTDYTDTPAERRPTAEKLHNLEVGLRHTTGAFQWSANYYLMLYRDQLVLSGRLDDVGNPIHTNVRDSYRTGIELQAAARLAKGLTFSPTATVSRNKINNYTDYLTDENSVEHGTQYKQTDISFSPSLTFAYTLEYELVPGLRLATLARYASRQYLDNTATDSRSIPQYYVQDVRLRYLWHPSTLGFREIELAAVVNNVLGATYVNNGYTYGYLYGGQAYYQSYFYPQARQNFLASLNLRW